MEANSSIPWEKIYHLTLSLGNIHDMDTFCTNLLLKLQEICPYDQGLIYFLDTNGKVYKQYLANINEQWSQMYLTYYSDIAQQNFSISRGLKENRIQPAVTLIDWEIQPKDEFIIEYIFRRGLKCSLGFSLTDLNEIPRTVFALDRTHGRKFSEKENNLLQLVVSQVNNLYKNFYYQQSRMYRSDNELWITTNLTQRENEIANLLCQGMTTSNISEMLSISPSTTYRHIANIYEKMNVSSRQDLLVRLLG